MIECDQCSNLFHIECVSVSEEEAVAMDTYTCAECQVGEDGSGIAILAGVATATTPIEVAPFSGHNMQGEGRANFERALNGGQSRQ